MTDRRFALVAVLLLAIGIAGANFLRQDGRYATIQTSDVSGLDASLASKAPVAAQYWVGAADTDLTAEKNLGALSTGLVLNTAGVPSAYAGTSCTNKFPRSLSASGAATCANVDTNDLLDGTVGDADLRFSTALSVIGRSANTNGAPADIAAASDGQVLRRASSVLGFGALDLDSANSVTGSLGVASGGTNLASYTQGDLLYATGATTLAKLAKGTADQLLRMNAGATAPEWSGPTGFEAYRAAGTLTLVTAAATTLTFDTEVRDEDGAGGSWFVHTTGTATTPRAGWYVFAATCGIPGIDDTERAQLQLYVDGAEYRLGGYTWMSTASASQYVSASFVVHLAASKLVTMRCYHTEGANQTAVNGASSLWFSGAQLR
jgi:hypothetical protein